MLGYNFTDRVRLVLQLAREHAAELGHDFVGPEHILLGIAAEGEGVAASVLTNLGVDLAVMAEDVKRACPPGTSRMEGPDFPYTSRAKKVLEYAMTEARDLDHSYVGSEHVLLGILRAEPNAAATVVAGYGVTLDRARAETTRLLGSPGRGSAGSMTARMLDQPGTARRALVVAIIALAVALTALVLAVRNG